jgi:N-acetylmuramoyl-L-alanine amidase
LGQKESRYFVAGFLYICGMRNITHIVIHCTAGFGGRQVLENHWRSIGWSRVGYHRLINLDGTIETLSHFDQVTNGVSGHNANSIHIAYVGGVRRNAVTIPEDTRTEAQNRALLICIKEAQEYVRKGGGPAEILGHRDFPNVRKACPSFDVRAWLRAIGASWIV